MPDIAEQRLEEAKRADPLRGLDLRPRFLFRTPPMPCPYLAGQIERHVFAEIAGTEAGSLYGALSRAGFRRSHRVAYRPACPSCNACVPVRIDAGRFRPTRSQRRVLRDNLDLVAIETPPLATPEQFRLFARYQRSRHGDGEMARMAFEDYRAMVEDSAVGTALVELRDREGQLLGACLFDRLGDGLSAVYSFFDPEETARGLGTRAVLWLIDQARAERLPFVYLGYWIADSRKMAYKARFQPLQALQNGAWQDITA